MNEFPQFWNEDHFQTFKDDNNYRIILKNCSESFAIDHFTNRSYWRKENCESSPFGEVAVLKSVCWLNVHGMFESIKPGKYLVFWRIFLDQNSFSEVKGNWRIGVGRRSLNQFQPDAVEGDHEVVNFFTASDLASKVGMNQWMYIVQGVIRVREESDVEARCFGGNPLWCGGIKYDYVSLLSLSVPWKVIRLILIARKYNEGRNFSKQGMDDNICSLVFSFL